VTSMATYQPMRMLGTHDDGRQSDLGSFTAVVAHGNLLTVWPGNRALLQRDTHDTWLLLDNQGRPQARFVGIELTTLVADPPS
jgi:hypothetical protein